MSTKIAVLVKEADRLSVDLEAEVAVAGLAANLC
jgi:hypothetical protein